MEDGYAHYPSLVDRSVLITGGATGIGAGFVEHFVDQGAHVAFIDIDANEGEALAARLRARGKHAPTFVSCDLCDIPALQSAIDIARRHVGAIRVLVNNAANDLRHTIEEVTVASFDAAVAVNLRHQFFAAQAVACDMRATGGGSIINLGSISWMVKQGNMPIYTTSKAAIHGLTRSLARDLGRDRIRVNTLVPGWVMTAKQLRLWIGPSSESEIDQNQCLPGRLQASDVARMGLFLASDDSRMCTGQDFVVDAGWS